MKKSLFIMALGAIALTSCSQDEIIEVKKDAIGFSVATENASRANVAGNITTSTLPSFNVYAYDAVTGGAYISNVNAVVDTGDQVPGAFMLTNTYYWPINKLNFYCVYPATKELTAIDVDNANAKIASYSCENTGTAYHSEDLLYSVSMETTKGAGGVAAINFRHALSMLAFQAKSDASYGLDVTISKVEIVNVANSGSYTLPNETTGALVSGAGNRGVWASTVFTNTYTFDIDDITVSANNNAVASGDSYFALPQALASGSATKTENAYFKLYCDVSRNGSAIRVATNPIYVPVDGTWAEGYKYTYTFVFGAGAGYEEDLETPVIVPISFNCTVDEMQAADAQNVTM